MKLLLFSDIHCSISLSEQIAEKAANADVVICAGDIASVRRGLLPPINVLKKITKPVLLVPCNNESLDELQAACYAWENASVLHGNSRDIDGITFFGIGGGIPVTPFGSWSWDFSEEQARSFLKECPDKAVLISHSPPFGAVDVSSSGQSLGSKAVRDVILEKELLLVVCGHIHESGGKSATLGKTTVINAGPNSIFFDLKVS